MDFTLTRANENDAKLIWQMQLDAFADLLKKYQDYDTNPGNETLGHVIRRLSLDSTYYYLIKADDKVIGAIRIIDTKDNQTQKRISPLFILPAYRGKGFAQMAIREAERIHGSKNWTLDTILQEDGNCYLYEKMGYRLTGETMIINEQMTLVCYEK